MHTAIKVVNKGGPRQRMTYRVAVAPTEAALKLDARTAEGKAAGLIVQYVKGSRAAADAAAWQMFNAAHEIAGAGQ